MHPVERTDASERTGPTYTAVEGCLTATVGDAAVVLLPSMEYLELDEVGAAIFDALGRHRTVPAIVDELLAVYDVDAGTLTTDVVRLLDRLVEHGAVERRPAS